MSSQQGVAMTAGAEWRRHWPLVAATASGMSLAALSVMVMGMMMGPIEEEFGWTRAQKTPWSRTRPRRWATGSRPSPRRSRRCLRRLPPRRAALPAR